MTRNEATLPSIYLGDRALVKRVHDEVNERPEQHQARVAEDVNDQVNLEEPESKGITDVLKVFGEKILLDLHAHVLLALVQETN